MTIFVLSILFVVCLAYAFGLKPNGFRFIFLLTFLLFVIVGQGWLAQFLLIELQEGKPLKVEQWDERNAIVLLGMGVNEWPLVKEYTPASLGSSRVLETLKLYFDCKSQNKSCLVVTSGGDPLHLGQSEAQVMRNSLIRLGVSGFDIELERKSNNTFQNAQFTNQILQQKNIKKVVVVTSGTHLRRSLLFFKHFGTNALGAPSDYLQAELSYIPRSINFVFTDLALHEYFGILRYYIYTYLGWNPIINPPKSFRGHIPATK